MQDSIGAKIAPTRHAEPSKIYGMQKKTIERTAK
jgi:hypothetical protein